MPDKLGIVAGRGALPRWLVSACVATGRPCFVLAIEHQTDPETVNGVDHRWIRLGNAGEGFRVLREAGVTELVLAGAINKPSLKDLKPDLRTRRFLRKLMWNSLGDDGLLRGVIQELEEEGFRVVGSQDVLSDILAAGGVLGDISPAGPTRSRDIPLGLRAAAALGLADAGQAVLVHEGRVIGLEDARGTERLIVEKGCEGAILVKVKKPNQDTRVDLPAIGPGTVRQCVAVGCAGIVVQQGGAIILDQPETLAAANDAGIFVMGVPPCGEDVETWPRLYLIAGEASGDRLGGALVEALRRLTGGRAVIHGIAGVEMTAQGMRSLFPMSELSLMGLTEIVPHLPRLLRRLRQTRNDVLRVAPRALVTIDAPGFSLRVARALAGSGIKLIHYVAPSVWAWKPGRAKKLAHFLDHLLALLPFEPPYFEKEGLPCSFVGHPVLVAGWDQGSPMAANILLQLQPSQPLLCILPGSRGGEIRRLLPIFRETVSRLAKSLPDLVSVIPQAPGMETLIKDMTQDWPTPLHLISSDESKAHIFARANAALAASGTVSLELAVAGTPNVAAYVMSPITAWLAKRLVRSKYFSLVNIVQDREIVPERFQDDCRPEILEKDLKDLITSESARSEQQAGMRAAIQALARHDEPPADAAARKILEVIGYELDTGETA